MKPLARPRLPGPLLVAFGLWLGSTAGRADGLPADTSTIESLTAEQAQALVTELSVVQVPGASLQIETVYGLTTLRRCLSLKGLKSVDAEAAQAIAGYSIGPVLLDGVATLSDDAARAIAQHKGWLSLNGLTTLSDTAARALSQHNGPLSLNGLTTLPDESARSLSQHKGWLSLNGLTTLSDEAAMALGAGWIAKPFTFEHLHSVIREELSSP